MLLDEAMSHGGRRPTGPELLFLEKNFFGIWYSKAQNFRLVGFTNSDYVGFLDDRKSTSESCFSLGLTVVTWSSKN